ncbi:hypothetical protein IQ22_03461 [Pseudomonas duriflava]|uniref:Uncharacterized protein n=1 Tax=Pseudomonas duriflava TaxID=459528 RepID=A0A562Q6I2_9PSED|nr:hypothetical protein IQ22_03461 [Pseudomonas duriflava]
MVGLYESCFESSTVQFFLQLSHELERLASQLFVKQVSLAEMLAQNAQFWRKSTKTEQS